MTYDPSLLARRREQIDVEDHNLRAQLDRLAAERKQIEEVESYLEGLARKLDQGPIKAAASPDSEDTSIGGKPSRPKSPPRPEGIPTIAGMIDAVLLDAERRGAVGLSNSALIKAIGDRFWPGVVGNSIIPSAYRFVEQKRLGRRGDLFVRLVGESARDEAVDEVPATGLSTASVQPEAQGREAGPGGGG